MLKLKRLQWTVWRLQVEEVDVLWQINELLRIYFFIPLHQGFGYTQEFQGNINAQLKVNFLILAAFPEWKASARIMSMPYFQKILLKDQNKAFP